MASQYSLKTFLRQVRGALLNRCLRRHEIDLDLNIEIIKPSVVDEMFQKLSGIPAAKLRVLETDFAAIAELSSSKATDVILREARRRGLDFSEIFLHARNGYERACWCFLEHPQVFATAACFFEMDSYGDGRWNRRYLGTDLTPATAPPDLDRLASLMRRSFAREGRGRHCHIDFYLREEPRRYCFFAFPEDHSKSRLSYTDAGELHQQTHKAAFEVIFVYRPEEGLLEVLAPGGAERVDDLASCFCSTILSLPALPPKMVPKLYDLSRLKLPDVCFPTDAEDGIERVELREVSLHLTRDHGWKRRVVFSADDKAYDRASIHEMILRTIGDDVLLDDVVVASAKFRFTFAAVDNQRAKRLTFTLGSPDRCSLRDSFHDHVARKYLRRWRLAVDRPAASVRR